MTQVNLDDNDELGTAAEPATLESLAEKVSFLEARITQLEDILKRDHELLEQDHEQLERDHELLERIREGTRAQRRAAETPLGL